MERFRLAQATIETYLGKLSVSQKLLIGTLATVMAMTLFLVHQYTKAPEMVELAPGMTAEDATRVVEYLEANNINYIPNGSSVMVPVTDVSIVRARLFEEGRMPSDNTLLFNNLVDNWSWTHNYKQGDQMAMIARQNELNGIIGRFSGISKATVIMDVPTRRSLGQANRVPSAAVTVFPTGSLSQTTVDAIANMVASSTAGLSVHHVSVIDGTNNRQYKARSEDDFTASTYAEHVANIETAKRDQITELLSYISGAIVAVHAQADVTTQRRTSQKFDNEDQGSVRLQARGSSSELSQEDAQDAAEAGARANTGIDINTGNASGSSLSEATGDNLFDTHAGFTRTDIVDPRGMPIKINAVVNIPRDYFVSVYRIQNPPDPDAPADEQTTPTDADLASVIDSEVDRIREAIQPLVDTSAHADASQVNPDGSTGSVVVSMIPVASDQFLQGVDAGGGGAGFMGIAGLDIADLIRTAVLGGLAVVALFLVVSTAFKANKREILPTAEELVGIPKALDSDLAIVGEAAEAEAHLDGVEMSEEDIQLRSMLDQINELIGDNPDRAAGVIGRWAKEDV